MNDLQSLVALLLATSLATERVVTIFKTAFPKVFADAVPAQPTESEFVVDQSRRVKVLAVSVIFSFITAFLLALTGDSLWSVSYGGEARVPTLLLGLLSSGGSAFWSNALGYVSAVKDIKQKDSKIATVDEEAAAAMVVQPRRPLSGVSPTVATLPEPI